jgi:hypothetical protein
VNIMAVVWSSRPYNSQSVHERLIYLDWLFYGTAAVPLSMHDTKK